MRKSNNRPSNLKMRNSKGFTLTEILVGVLIGLIGTIVIFQVFAISESQKRTTTGGSDAQQNGVFALYSMEQDIRNAGSGLGGLSAASFNCRVLAHNSSVPTDFNFPLIPLMIIDGGTGTNNSDIVTVMYGVSALVSTAVGFKTSGAPTGDYVVSSNQGYNVGDLIIAMENTSVIPYPDCTLAQVSALPGGGTNITHDIGTGIKFNKAIGLGVTYSASASLINLGTAPTVIEYYVDSTSSQLRSHDVLTGTARGAATDIPIVNTVVNMQAQYGIDTDGNDVIDAWQEPTGAWASTALTATKISQIKAIRLAVLTQSLQLEKTNVSPASLTVFSDNAAGATPASAAITIPNQRFRYQTFETVIPIRNVIWNY